MSDNELFQSPLWYSQDEVNKIREEHTANMKRLADEIERLTKERDYAIKWANKANADVKESYEREFAVLRARVSELEKALERQGDNMAFVINHVTIPNQWYEKFRSELEEDRAALDAVKGADR